MATEDSTKSLLVEEEEVISYEDLVEKVTQFQQQLQSLDYRVTNKNFGSKLYQTKETINSKSRFVAGAEDDIAIIDAQHPTYRLWIGAEDPTDAPFSVDKDGNLYGESVTLTGYLQVGEALGDVQTDIADLSDIDDDLGVITAGTLIGLTVIGGTVKTSSSGQRVEMSGATNSLNIYDTSSQRMKLSGDTLLFYSSAGAVSGGILGFTTDVLQMYAGGSSYLFSEDAFYPDPFLGTDGDLGTASNPWNNFYLDDYIQINNGGIFLLETGTGTNSVLLRAPVSLAADIDFILPDDEGSSGEVLHTNGNGETYWDAVSGGANTALSNLTSTAINTDLISDADAVDDLGSSTYHWDNLYVENVRLRATGNIYYNNVLAFDFDTGADDIYVGSSGLTAFLPYTSGGVLLGSSTYRWSTLSVTSIECYGTLNMNNSAVNNVSSLDMDGDIDMNDNIISAIDEIRFTTGQANTVGTEGGMTFYDSGTIQYRGQIISTEYSFDLTSV